MRLSRAFPLFTLVAVLLPLMSNAASFPDVPSSYPHRIAIDMLTERGVVSGHPDGLFRPHDPVDRASMLKLLYKAAGLTADPTKKGCFTDVVKDSWYEAFACDAYNRGFVQGYDGKLFKPARPVSRAEALKLLATIIGLPIVTDGTSRYTDVRSSDWFFSFVVTAENNHVLPIPGQDGPQLMPSVPLERGEAAAYVWNALEAKKMITQKENPVQVASSSSAQSSTEERKKVEEKTTVDAIAKVSFPFSDTPAIADKKSVSYQFSLSSPLTAQISVGLAPGSKGSVTCRLYRLEKTGFSSEYYLGIEESGICTLRTALSAGDYQLQIQPTVANAYLTLEAKAGTGDGNDGFSQAKVLEKGKLRTDLLDANDLEDWFTFTVKEDTSVTTIPGTQMSVNVASAGHVGCIIYPLEDVDIFGFSGPECNQSYLFPKGTYMVSVRHTPPKATKQGYSIVLQK